MGFFADFKAKRAAKRARADYELELFEWDRENQVLAQSQLLSGHLQNYSQLFQIQIEQISSSVFPIDKNHPAYDSHPRMATPSPTYSP
jgi:DNA-directed RNA polymerase beta subunit